MYDHGGELEGLAHVIADVLPDYLDNSPSSSVEPPKWAIPAGIQHGTVCVHSDHDWRRSLVFAEAQNLNDKRTSTLLKGKMGKRVEEFKSLKRLDQFALASFQLRRDVVAR